MGARMVVRLLELALGIMRFPRARNLLRIQGFVAEFAVETLHLFVLVRPFRFDVRRLDS